MVVEHDLNCQDVGSTSVHLYSGHSYVYGLIMLVTLAWPGLATLTCNVRRDCDGLMTSH